MRRAIKRRTKAGENTCKLPESYLERVKLLKRLGLIIVLRGCICRLTKRCIHVGVTIISSQKTDGDWPPQKALPKWQEVYTRKNFVSGRTNVVN
jgi:hypothetical protein